MKRPSTAADADVLIVGGGIAGWSAAYFASRAGRRVTVVDDGAHRASDLPIALVNPLRGHDGRLVSDGVEGMTATFALVDALRADGHAIDAGRGLFRPLLDVAPVARERSFWERKVDGRLSFAWHDAAPASLGLVDRVPALFLHDAGWLAPVGLLDALRSASGATVLRGRVVELRRGADDLTAVLADGSAVTSRTLLWCAGAWGAALLDAAPTVVADGGRRHRDSSSPAPASAGPVRAPPAPPYKAGSLVGTAVPLCDAAMSFGLYAVPRVDRGADGPVAGTLIGPTREGAQSSFPDGTLPADAARHLGDRVARTFGTTIPVHEVWRGVRLARLSSAAATALDGVPALTALGSRGFLVGPLLASRWASSL